MSLLRTLDWPPVWTVAFMALASGAAELWSPLGTLLLWPGRLLIAAGLGLALWAALAFARARTTIIPRERPSGLVATGPFRYTRNPIYVADLLILAGWVLTTGQPIALVMIWALKQILETRFVLLEETVLTVDLGESYRSWAATVPRWLGLERYGL
ncbi:MAG: methyltransferase [Pseudomonadota bacterium]